jgi:hypothetical protein
LPIQALKEQLNPERTIVAALRAAIVCLSTKLEMCEANLCYKLGSPFGESFGWSEMVVFINLVVLVAM